MSKSLQLNLPPTPLQKLSQSEVTLRSQAKPSESPRNFLKEWAELPDAARRAAGLKTETVAVAINKSESWTSRAFRGLEKLGWVDLYHLDDVAFWEALLTRVAELRGASFGKNEAAERDAELGRRIRGVFELLR